MHCALCQKLSQLNNETGQQCLDTVERVTASHTCGGAVLVFGEVNAGTNQSHDLLNL